MVKVKIENDIVDVQYSVDTFYQSMLTETHLLVAGRTGSGKSIVINGIIATALSCGTPEQYAFILVDAKRTEFAQWKNTPHCVYYATELNEIKIALNSVMDICDKRFKAMQTSGQKICTDTHVFLVIDEMADLMLGDKANKIILQRIMQIARASNVHVIAGTQVFLASVVPTPIKANFTAVCCLKTRSAQDSRNVLGDKGAEALPSFDYSKGQGQCLYLNALGINERTFKVIEQEEVNEILDEWKPLSKAIKKKKNTTAVDILFAVGILFVAVIVLALFIG